MWGRPSQPPLGRHCCSLCLQVLPLSLFSPNIYFINEVFSSIRILSGQQWVSWWWSWATTTTRRRTRVRSKGWSIRWSSTFPDPIFFSAWLLRNLLKPPGGAPPKVHSCKLQQWSRSAQTSTSCHLHKVRESATYATLWIWILLLLDIYFQSVCRDRVSQFKEDVDTWQDGAGPMMGDPILFFSTRWM